jgi:hypothetical protein
MIPMLGVAGSNGAAAFAPRSVVRRSFDQAQAWLAWRNREFTIHDLAARAFTSLTEAFPLLFS